MNTEELADRCPNCQVPLSANAPRGLCAKCLLAAGATPTEAGQPGDRKPPPPIATVAAAFPQLDRLSDLLWLFWRWVETKTDSAEKQKRAACWPARLSGDEDSFRLSSCAGGRRASSPNPTRPRPGWRVQALHWVQKTNRERLRWRMPYQAKWRWRLGRSQQRQRGWFHLRKWRRWWDWLG